MKKSVVINSDDCIGCGSYLDICSDVFSFDETATVAIVKKLGVESEGCIKEAMESCPTQCISWSSNDCTSCETCLILYFEVFSLNENEDMTEGILPEGDIEGCLGEAFESCPAECLIRVDS